MFSKAGANEEIPSENEANEKIPAEDNANEEVSSSKSILSYTLHNYLNFIHF